MTIHYKAAGKPETYRSREEFLERVNEELEDAGGDAPDAATRTVLALLEERVTERELEDVRHMLPSSVRSLWPDT
ncbi:MAG: DUF2267 domain-containing protein [Salinibacter sp.]